MIINILKATLNTLKKGLLFLRDFLFKILFFIIIWISLMCLLIGATYFIGTIILNDGNVYDEIDYIFINIGLLEMIIIPILFFVLSVRKEYKKIISQNNQKESSYLDCENLPISEDVENEYNDQK